ncbi:MAG: HD domain-containing protein [Bacteroidales bacterium]|nr:HD domain-containing protein [Bacteroidales bacterium]
MNFEAAKEYVFNKLNNDLDPELTYHSSAHTTDVINAVERLAQLEGVNGRDVILLKTAALFHDIGFINTYDGHEKASVKIAREILPDMGYSSEDINKIEGMIYSTEIPQSPTNHLEMILADADLDYLGRDDIFIIGQRLQYEWRKLGMIHSLKEWHEKQLEFLKSHRYFTQSARKLRENKKQENIKEVEALVCPKN